MSINTVSEQAPTRPESALEMTLWVPRQGWDVWMVAVYIYLHVGVFVWLVFVFMIRSDSSNRILLEPCSRKAFVLQGDDSVHLFFFPPYLRSIGSDSFWWC